MEVKIEIIKRETIKPSSPTPPELRDFRLSQFDQLNPAVYTPFLLFYLGDNTYNDREHKLTRLKTSLSETLKRFYPFAGRIRDNIVIDCNDEGIEFIETTVDARLSEVLKKPDAVVLKEFLPVGIASPDAAMAWLMLVQANFFKCGGLAIGICMTHKLTDAATLSTFMNAWAGVARGSPDVVLPILTAAASMFPPLNELAGPLSAVEVKRTHCIARRYVIGPSAIVTLKEKGTNSVVSHPTAVEVVTSLIWKCAAKAFRANFKSGNQSSSIVSQVVNLRKRFDPTLPENLVGNLTSIFFAREVESDSNLQTLVANLREGLEACHRDVVEKLQKQNDFSGIYEAIKQYGKCLNDDQLHFFGCTSWCRFPLYEVDFGWGSPTWVTTPNAEVNNVFILMNTKAQDGIEVWLTLGEEIMSVLEKDEELLEFASLNPNVL